MLSEPKNFGPEPWLERSKRLRYSLGGIVLYAAQFRTLVLDIPFTRLTRDPDQPPPPLRALTFRVPAAFIYSHPIEGTLPRFGLLPQAIRYVPSQYRRFHIVIQASFADYLKKFSSQQRYNLRRRVEKFAQASGGVISWREFRRPTEIAEFYRLARLVSQKTYQERQLDAGLPKDDHFLEELTELARRDGMRGYVLLYRQVPIAYNFCRVVDEVLTCEKSGYDPKFRQAHPGIVLLYLMLEKLFAEQQFQKFDFGRGEYSYKAFFATGSIKCADIYYFRRTPARLLLLLIHSGLDMISKAAAAVLDGLSLKIRLKRVIRRLEV